MTSIAIIDYGMGNLHSIAKALEHVAGKDRVLVTGVHETILAADRVVFPGVGAIRDCMAELQRSGLAEVVVEAVRTKPVLGVCLGMQALLDASEENQGIKCLGVIPGKVERFPQDMRDAAGDRLKIPHMGWNQVHSRRESKLFDDIADGVHFYFVHSYAHAVTDDTLATSDYGGDFSAVIEKNNFAAAQFHPERSGECGARFLANFLRRPSMNAT